jgi:hypothetical protein
MARLQRRILAIIGKTEQFARFRIEVGGVHRFDGAQRDQRGRRAAPLAAQARQFPKVVPVSAGVHRAAGEACEKRRSKKPGVHCTARTGANPLRIERLTVGAHVQALWCELAILLLQCAPVAAHIEPRVGQRVLEFLAPGVGADQQVSGARRFGHILAAQHRVPRDNLTVLLVVGAERIMLTTFAAENKREE